MARRSSEIVLQLGPRTLAGLELVLTKESGMRLAHFRSAGKRSEYVCGEVSGVLVEVLALVLDRVMFQISPIPRASVPYTLENQQRSSTMLLKIDPGLGPVRIGGRGQI
jgi:hypothetical protein